MIKGQMPTSMFQVFNSLKKDPYFFYFRSAQGNSDSLSLFEDSHMPRHLTNYFLLWINENRLCLHVGLGFWTIFSFTSSKSTNFTTCKFCFSKVHITQCRILNLRTKFEDRESPTGWKSGFTLCQRSMVTMIICQWTTWFLCGYNSIELHTFRWLIWYKLLFCTTAFS